MEQPEVINGVQHFVCRGTNSCGQVLPITSFNRQKARAGRGKHFGIQYNCKECSQTYARTRAQNGALQPRLDKHRQVIIDAKNRPCMDCGNVYPSYVMDFDHRPDEVKSFTIGWGVGRNLDMLLLEIAKCDVVCSNCHRIRTFTRRGMI